MKKRILSLLMAIILVCSMIPAACAASDEATAAADTLYSLGLFQGTGTDASGKPIYDLDRAPTRHEAVTMLVRLLGKDAEAKGGMWPTPFGDVANWAKPYVGYAYAFGLTSGTGATTFGGDAIISASQYLTFVLRALGYESGTDFQWNKAWELSDRLGITAGQYNESSTFTRGDVAVISLQALSAYMKGQSITLAESIGISTIPTPELPPEETPALVLTGLWQAVDATGAVEEFHFEGDHFVRVTKNADSCTYVEGTFALINNVITLTAESERLSYSFRTGEIRSFDSFTGPKYTVELFLSRFTNTPESSILNEVLGYVSGSADNGAAEDDLFTGYWLGINSTSDAQFLECYSFTGNTYTCAYRCLDNSDNILFTIFEEGTFTFANDTLTLKRETEYSYREGFASTDVTESQKVLEYAVVEVEQGILMNNWFYTRYDQAASVCDQLVSYVMDHVSTGASVSSADYAYLAGNDFRSIRRDYPSAVAQCAYVYAFVDLNGDLCVLTDVRYKITSNWSEVTLHNMTKGTVISDPADYYQTQANRAYGASKIQYLNLANEVLGHHMKMLSAMSSILKGGSNTYDGVYVDAATLNL